MLSIIVALAPNHAIGFKQQLLWKITEDLQYFKRTTTGHCVVMGRKTFESIGRPLPHRQNIIISRTLVTPPTGTHVAHSLTEAITLAAPPDSPQEIFIMGGSEIYHLALPLANKLYVTHIKATPPQADSFFPRFDWRQWKEVFREDHPCGVAFPHPFSFVVYERTLLQHNYNIDPFSVY